VVKDIVLRYYRMRGYNVWDKPGYDTHGLPIEVKIEQKLGVRVKKEIPERIGIDRFVMECKRFVDENMEAMTRQFKEIGVFMDWDNPYITYTDDYIESGWWLIKRAWEQGLLYEGLRVLHWCPRCETTLADYEVSEYREIRDPSIYVKFPVKGRRGEYLLIWTTTPWTLPANAFVMAHPELKYVRVRVGGEVLILAKARLEDVMREAGVREYEVLEEFPGRELEGLEYEHPLEDLVPAQRELARFHRVVMAPEAVTPYEGTGLVHSAPGHGTVDAAVGERLGAPLLSLVDDRGFMTEGAGKYKGMYFRGEANEAIIRDLEERGALFHKGEVVHRYPVCWRCKTPLLLRATRQWFIAVTKLRDRLMEEAERIEWQPGWAKERFRNMLRELRDWVISRQRFWGIPLPVWVCRSCGYKHVVGSVKELEEMGGRRPENLHRPWIDEVVLRCPKCGGEMRRVPDVLDVWFDSGVAFYASLGYPMRRDLWERLRPVDFIVEGHDQIRGWFFSLLRSGVIGFGETPYKRVLVHGFMLDEQGREMHKSLGNYVEFEELISKVPRDVVRLWLLQNTVWEDLRFSWKGLDMMRRDFTVIWNVFSFASLYMSLDGFDPEEQRLEDLEEALEPEDRWILSKTQRLVAEYHRAMEQLKPHEAARMLRSFIVEEVSHWYIRLIRRRVWEEEDTPSKRAAYATLYRVLRTWTLLAAPFIPFTAEYLWQRLFRPSERGAAESVHLEELPGPDERWVDERLERDMEALKRIAEAVLAARQEAGLKLRRPVRRVILALGKREYVEAVERLGELLKRIVNAKEIELAGPEFFRQVAVYRVEPEYGALGPRYKKDLPLVLELLRERGGKIARELTERGVYRTVYKGVEVELTPGMVKISVEPPEWLAVKEFEGGVVGVDKRLGREELVEGIAREVVRRIQAMRKEAGYRVEDYVVVWVKGDSEVEEAVRAMRDYVAREVRAVELRVGEEPRGAEVAREWEVDGERLLIGLKRAEPSG
jgi:isoleucyl-tRNA synthetase